MTVASYAIEVDWTNAGNFNAAGSDITADVMDVETESGRDFASQITGRASAGRMTLTLNNQSGNYSPAYASGSHYGNILPGLPIRLSANGTPLWYGLIDGFIGNSQISNQVTCKLTCAGVLKRLTRGQGKKINVPVQITNPPGTIITAILTAAGFTGGTTFDAGQSYLTAYWRDIYALEAMREIEECEAGFLYEDLAGGLVFEDRHHRLSGAHLISQATFSDAPGAALRYREITRDDPFREIFNDVSAEVQNYVTGALAVLWTLTGETPVLAPGQTRKWIATYPSPNTGAPSGAYTGAWTTPVVGTDVTQSGVANGDIAVSAVKTANTMEISVTNNNATKAATLTLVRARGTPVTKGTPTQVSSSDATSQSKYNRVGTYIHPAKWFLSTQDAQNSCDYIVSRYKDSQAVLTILLPASQSAALMTQALTRKLSDRITIVANNSTKMGIVSSDFFIETIKHKIDMRGKHHETTFQLSPALADSGYWIVGQGILDTSTVIAW